MLHLPRTHVFVCRWIRRTPKLHAHGSRVPQTHVQPTRLCRRLESTARKSNGCPFFSYFFISSPPPKKKSNNIVVGTRHCRTCRGHVTRGRISKGISCLFKWPCVTRQQMYIWEKRKSNLFLPIRHALIDRCRNPCVTTQFMVLP